MKKSRGLHISGLDPDSCFSGRHNKQPAVNKRPLAASYLHCLVLDTRENSLSRFASFHSWQPELIFLKPLTLPPLLPCSSLKIALPSQTAPTHFWIISALSRFKKNKKQSRISSVEATSLSRLKARLWPQTTVLRRSCDQARKWGQTSLEQRLIWQQLLTRNAGALCADTQVQTHTPDQARQWLTHTLTVTTSSDRATQAPPPPLPSPPPLPPPATSLFYLHPSFFQVLFFFAPSCHQTLLFYLPVPSQWISPVSISKGPSTLKIPDGAYASNTTQCAYPSLPPSPPLSPLISLPLSLCCPVFRCSGFLFLWFN